MEYFIVKLAITVNIQSYTNVITNSSSEILCAIWSEQKETVSKLLKSIFYDISRYDGSWVEDSPGEMWASNDEPGSFEHKVELHIAQDENIRSEFIKKIVLSLLDEKIGKENYKIKFYE